MSRPVFVFPDANAITTHAIRWVALTALIALVAIVYFAT